MASEEVVIFVTQGDEDLPPVLLNPSTDASIGQDGSRSVIRRALVQVIAIEIAQIVVAHLQREKGLPYGVADCWMEFEALPISEMRAPDLALVLAMSDPTFPEHEPQLIRDLVAEARTSLDQAAELLARHVDKDKDSNDVERSEAERDVSAELQAAKPQLDAEAWEILASLHAEPNRFHRLEEICAATRISRKTIGKRITELIDYGIAHRSKGPRSGVAITDLGRDLVRKNTSR